MIVAYHPPLFKPLSSFTLANPLQKSLLRLASAGVSVYSPHSALDSVDGGVNDWIASAFGKGVSITCFQSPEKDSRVHESTGGYPGGRMATLHTPLSLDKAVAAVKKHFRLSQGLLISLFCQGCSQVTVHDSSDCLCRWRPRFDFYYPISCYMRWFWRIRDYRERSGSLSHG